MPSPCVKTCKIENGVCIGCGRSLKLIACWSKLTTQEQRNWMQVLKSKPID